MPAARDTDRYFFKTGKKIVYAGIKMDQRLSAWEALAL